MDLRGHLTRPIYCSSSSGLASEQLALRFAIVDSMAEAQWSVTSRQGREVIGVGQGNTKSQNRGSLDEDFLNLMWLNKS